ncbi:hypothetical protein COT30_03150 [Candidatus Micrarchaeota archaeon CG08_land_8_20_14_0_20_49_17]|nr:MAG: hypothetical protein AUJ13_01925 [Candidatus Micrarchaeota archaeon CG1_02_49_24]PIU09683.1 MAG: hypothetical protein COT30_03150 [Candidatus Micrarchaeota archaeon CG08_land_8_20_14_0_20_49_17]PIZ98118.1 MAG: hypothetical protein COX84_02565 [Candidatus Micrarchaeota archaeon CG_4_10_14_0_2_um_filter_49_7]HII53758.1 type II toxin-antitoxin system VapC family toxin [Candidatus Micrarchaeota archaeon]
MALLDTTTVIDVGKGNPRAIRAVEKAGKEGGRLMLSAVVLFELSAGSPPGIDEKRKMLVQAFGILPFGPIHAERAGVIYKELRDAGLDIGPLDAMIAAAAICEDEVLITSNVKHFARIKELKIQSY